MSTQSIIDGGRMVDLFSTRTQVPEPGIWALCLAGLLLVHGRMRRKRDDQGPLFAIR